MRCLLLFCVPMWISALRKISSAGSLGLLRYSMSARVRVCGWLSIRFCCDQQTTQYSPGLCSSSIRCALIICLGVNQLRKER